MTTTPASALSGPWPWVASNWLFAGPDRGGNAAAVAFSMIATCNLHRVEPFAYLADIQRRLPSHPINRVAKLLPFRWQPSAYRLSPAPRIDQKATPAITGIHGCLFLT